MEGAKRSGLEGDFEAGWGGVGEIGTVGKLDFGASANLKLRVRPGEVSEADLLSIIHLLLATDNPEAYEKAMEALTKIEKMKLGDPAPLPDPVE